MSKDQKPKNTKFNAYWIYGIAIVLVGILAFASLLPLGPFPNSASYYKIF